jgi:hypothetical protein
MLGVDKMSLENVLIALKHSMSDTLSELDESTLKDREARDILTAHFSENEARPELTSLFVSPSLMYQYLGLELKEKEELEGFRKNSHDHLLGKGKVELQLQKIESERVVDLIRLERYTNQLLRIFDFYQENREEFEVFSLNNIKKDKKIKAEFGNLGTKIHDNSFHNFREQGGIKRIFELATEVNPEIKKYSSFKELVKMDGIPRLLEMFEFYLENRKEKELFNYSYLRRNEALTERFGPLGRRIAEGANRNLEDNRKSGFEVLLEFAYEERPEIRDYTTLKNLFMVDAPKQLTEMFDFYLGERQKDKKKRKREMECVTFNSQYLSNNKRVQKRFDGLAGRTYQASMKYFKDCGKFDHLIDIVAETRPEIKKYAYLPELRKMEDTELFIKMFDFYLKHAEEEQAFNRSYLQSDKKLKRRFGNEGYNLVQRCDKHNFKEEGRTNYLSQLASEERPEISEHWKYQEQNMGLTQNVETEAPKELIEIFDFFLKNRSDGERFNTRYLRYNEEQIKRFGSLGQKVYSAAREHLREKGDILYVVELAARDRPDILEHWHYRRKSRRSKRK